MPHLTPLALSILCLTFAGPANAGSSTSKSEVSLIRPPNALDADAKGRVRLKSKTDKNEHEFEVKVENVDAELDHVSWLEDAVGSGVFVEIGELEQEDVDEVRYRVRTKKGDSLPIGAADNAALSGLAIEVRAKKLDFSGDATYSLFMEDALGSGVMVLVGTVAKVGASKGRYRSRTKDGDALPLNAADMAALGGFALEVRDEFGAGLLEGVVPSFN